MPRYNYRCDHCGIQEILWHSITEKEEDCQHCNTTGSLEKMISSFTTVDHHPTKTGIIVKRTIRELKEEIEMEKSKLKNKEME